MFRIHDILGWNRIRILDPDPAIFVTDLHDASKKLFFNTIFSAYYFLKVHLHNFSEIKSQKESQNRRNQCFSNYFCKMIEGSGSGSIPLTSESRSGRPKNMWIRWIRFRNTGKKGLPANLLILLMLSTSLCWSLVSSLWFTSPTCPDSSFLTNIMQGLRKKTGTRDRRKLATFAILTGHTYSIKSGGQEEATRRKAIKSGCTP